MLVFKRTNGFESHEVYNSGEWQMGESSICISESMHGILRSVKPRYHNPLGTGSPTICKQGQNALRF